MEGQCHKQYAGPSLLRMHSCCGDWARWGYYVNHAWLEGAFLTRCALPPQEVGRYNVGNVCTGLLEEVI